MLSACNPPFFSGRKTRFWVKLYRLCCAPAGTEQTEPAPRHTQSHFLPQQHRVHTQLLKVWLPWQRKGSLQMICLTDRCGSFGTFLGCKPCLDSFTEVPLCPRFSDGLRGPSLQEVFGSPPRASFPQAPQPCCVRRSHLLRLADFFSPSSGSR